MNVVFASHTSLLSPLKVGSHHLARELDRRGHRVVHLSPPMSPVHLLKARDPMVRSRLRSPVVTTPEGLVEVTPWLPLPGRVLDVLPGAAGLLHRGALPNVGRALRRLGCWPVDLLLIDYPYYLGLGARIGAGRTIYRATDVYPELLGRPRLAGVERRLVAAADVVVATSAGVATHLRSIGAEHVTVIPNGADVAAPTAVAADAGGSRTALYAGAVDERTDVAALAACAAAHPSVAFDVIGTVDRRLAATEWPANVRLLGARPHAEVLAMMTAADVGLLPLNDHPGNRGRSPIKLFEYLAQGLPVVAAATEEVSRLNLDRVFAYQAGVPEAAVRALDAALQAPPMTAAARDCAARAFSWSARTDELLAAVGGGGT